MTIWIDDPNGTDNWEELSPNGFAGEKDLQQLVFRSVGMLPLSGTPTVITLAREVEVPVTKGKIDVLAVDTDGTIVIIEVKLKQNQEARKAVVAQALSYAASLRGLPYDDLQSRLTLAGMSYNSVVEAVADAAPIDEETFKKQVAESLIDGRFRVVLVLDQAPLELVRLVGYLESVSSGLLTIDLLTVATYQVGERRVAIPQRLDPRHEQFAAAVPAPASPPSQVITEDGSGLFQSALYEAPETYQAQFLAMLEWANQLQALGLALLVSRRGPWRTVLTARIKGEDRGLMSLWNDHGQPYLWLHGTVIEKRAPTIAHELSEAMGKDLKGRVAIKWGDVTPELRGVLTEGYRQAAGQP